tara:strand:+ start:609 stop:791 length:183 start_codon:yes stop_codon:yes gene_type:complete
MLKKVIGLYLARAVVGKEIKILYTYNQVSPTSFVDINIDIVTEIVITTTYVEAARCRVGD